MDSRVFIVIMMMFVSMSCVYAAQCDDTIDNDGDGVTDLADSDCDDAADDSEYGSIEDGGEHVPGAICRMDGLSIIGRGLLVPIILAAIVFSVALISRKVSRLEKG